MRNFSLAYTDEVTENYWCGELTDEELDILWSSIDVTLSEIEKGRKEQLK